MAVYITNRRVDYNRSWLQSLSLVLNMKRSPDLTLQKFVDAIVRFVSHLDSAMFFGRFRLLFRPVMISRLMKG